MMMSNDSGGESSVNISKVKALILAATQLEMIANKFSKLNKAINSER